MRLRQLTIHDAADVFTLRTDEAVNKLVDRDAPADMAAVAAFITAINQRVQEKVACYWAIELVQTGQFAGTICLFNLAADGTKAEVGYELLPDCRGKGLMPEAVRSVISLAFEAGIQTIEAFSHPENGPSVALLQKLGFTLANTTDGFLVFTLQEDQY